MKKLVVFPSDPIDAYIKQGKSYDYLGGYFNPGDFFDEVYCLSIWGEKTQKIGKVTYRGCRPLELREIVKSIRPDVIRAYGGYISSDLAQLSRVEHIPIVSSIHDTNPDLIYPSVKYADYIVCMSQCVKTAVMSKLGISADRITVMPNRIDTKLFSKTFNSEYFDALNAKYGAGRHVLHVGRKARQKNLDTLIKSLRHLPADVSAIFVGSGDDSEYKSLAAKMQVGDRCHWVQAVKKDELPLWYSWCDCFCTPSRWEGFGFVFIEAAGCEAPIVTSNIAPMNEYLTNGKNALLVDEYENPEILAQRIKEALQEDDRIANMRREARNVGLRFSKDKVDKQEIELYENVISGGTKNRRLGRLERLKLHWKYRNYNYRRAKFAI